MVGESEGMMEWFDGIIVWKCDGLYDEKMIVWKYESMITS